MGHTTEAAQFAPKSTFTYADNVGLNSLFLAMSPCADSTLRVQVYGNSMEWVSVLTLTLQFEKHLRHVIFYSQTFT